VIGWRPDHTTCSTAPPNPGDLVAFEHAVYRVIEVNPVPQEQWTDEQRAWHAAVRADLRPRAVPVVVVARPATHRTGDARAGAHNLHLRSRNGRTEWHIYRDEHYPVCAQCGEPTPCRERLGMQEATAALERMARYEVAGICPACRTPVTERQRSLTFPDNLELPGGPPVTFHIGRAACRWTAALYEQRWVAADPDRRRTSLSCPGHLTNHNDGTYDCTEHHECRGPLARHQGYSTCRCPSCHAGGRFSSTPRPNARRNVG
jgi:hypothetical protein